MQLSMCDAGTVRVKKNTTNNNFGNLSPILLLLIVSRGMAYMRYLENPCAVASRDSFVRIPHINIYVKRFSKLF